MFRFFPLILLLSFSQPSWADRFQGRTFTITDGRSDKSKPAPMIIALHGFLGTPKSMKSKTSFDKLASQNGLLVAYMSGVKRRWNDGRTPGSTIDDVGYVRAFIQKQVSQNRADARAIFIAGHSNGGGMALRMACDVPNLIAGISVVATKVAQNYTCSRGQSVPAIFIYGTEDPVSPHKGRPAGSRLGATLSASESIALWSKRNKCTKVGKTQIIDLRDDQTKAIVKRYAGCKAALQYIEIEGHGHAWPGAGPRLQRLQGPATQEIDAARASWRFFKSL
jgi:polyhydroxybutyrate depolymerase